MRRCRPSALHSEELAASLRLVVEEDIQDRLLNAQKQMRSLRRLANVPAEGDPRSAGASPSSPSSPRPARGPTRGATR